MTRLFLSSFSAFLSDFLPLHLLTDLKRMLVVYYPAFNSTVRYVVWGMTFVQRVTENVDFVVHHHWSSSLLISFSSRVYSHRTLLLLPHFWLSFFWLSHELMTCMRLPSYSSCLCGLSFLSLPWMLPGMFPCRQKQNVKKQSLHDDMPSSPNLSSFSSSIEDITSGPSFFSCFFVSSPLVWKRVSSPHQKLQKTVIAKAWWVW